MAETDDARVVTPSVTGTAAGGERTAKSIEDRRRRWLTFGSFASMIFIWFALTGFGTDAALVSPVFLPSPGAVAERFVILATTGYQGASLLHHVGISMMRFGIAFAFCVVFGVGIGLLMGMSLTARSLLDPPIEVTRPIPKLALLPLFIIWFGIGELSKVLVIISALFPLMSISAMQAVRGVSVRKIQAAYSLGAARLTVLRRVLLPASLPRKLTGIRESIGIGVTMLVGAELIATSDGVAWMALSAADFLLTDVVLVGVLIMAAIGYGLDRIARLIENRLVHWSGKDG